MKNKKLFAILTLVCFMFTLMPVAAFAVDEQDSYVYVQDSAVKKGKDIDVELNLDATDADIYVWFEEVGYEDVAVKAVEVGTGDVVGASKVEKNGAFIVVTPTAKNVEFTVAIDRVGEYKIHAAATDMTAEVLADFKDELRTEAGYTTVNVKSLAADSSDYVIEYNGVIVKDGKSVAIANVPKTNGIDSETVEFVVYEDADKTDVVYASDIEIDTTSAVTVSDLEVKRSGKVSFDVTVNRAGTHKVYVTIGDYKATIKIDAREGEAEEIELAYAAKTAVNVKSANALVDTTFGLGNWIVFKVYDVNGTEITNWTAEDGGLTKACAGTAETNYVTLTEKPADSDLKSKDFYLVPAAVTEVGGNEVAADTGWTIAGAEFDEEGTYSFKVALDDGAYATASITVQESDDYVALNISYFTDTVTLGGEISPRSIVWLDKNYVSTTAVGYDFAVTGAAVKAVDGTKIIVKDDEKYVGSKIEVTVVDEENNLVATKTLTVASEAKGLAFDVTTVPVDSQKTVNVKLVDETGAAVAVTGVTTAEAYAIVLDKPADSDVTISDAKNVVAKKGQFAFDMSADTVGIVTVQAVLKVYDAEGVARYYTGVQEIKVGATGIEDTVVMSIGSNEIVVNNEIKTIDAAPIISNNRTFVPFRALAEAFGAVVNYDEATQAVTAELDGTTVVMTIGSAEYTVNGVAKTADVAPFINGSRTMVPVRFAAEAFGITVTPTYNDNGTTADVVFAK